MSPVQGQHSRDLNVWKIVMKKSVFIVMDPNHKKTGLSDMVSVSSSKSSKSKLLSHKKEPKVRLLAAANDGLEEHGVWKDPFAPSEETTLTVVEAITH
jgi:hypothetical protein